MNLDRMLERCRRHQWSADDLDWSRPPPPMSREKEIAVVQYFTDMAGIELLAKSLFEYQRDHADDPTLRAIFETFVVDEQRHADVALMLARYYDRNQYRSYRTNPHLVRFRDPFVNVLQYLSQEIASYYITAGEIFLDVALLRSINDYVNDEMSNEAMTRINRDESRHIAMDFQMIDRYTSPEHLEAERHRPKPSLKRRAQGARAMLEVLYYAGPFARDVFFGPIDRADPSGRRLMQAFKRIQLVGMMPQVKTRPFPRFTKTMEQIYLHPKSGPLVRMVAARAVGVDPRVIAPIYTEEELRAVEQMTFEEHAREVLKEKTLN